MGMINREKVIKGLGNIVSDMQEEIDEWRDYSDSELSHGLTCDCEWWYNTAKMLKDALALLKEQEAKWIHREDLDFKDKLGCIHFHGMCGNCGFIHDFIDGHTGQYLYCPQCGQAVKWE